MSHQELIIVVIWEYRAQWNYPLLPSILYNLSNAASDDINIFWGQLNYGFMMNSPLTGPSESPSLFWKLDFNLVLTQGQYSIAFFFFSSAFFKS